MGGCAKARRPMTEQADLDLRPKLIGARIKRTEDPRLLTGLGSFVDDRQVPNVLHVAFRRSDHAHARIRAIDTAAARAAAGVAAVFTASDFAETVKPLRATSRMKGYYATPIRALAHEKVRYVGEPVAGVIAESRYLAEDAAERLAIDFEPLPHTGDPVEAARPGAPLLHEEAGTNVLVAREFRRGDVDAALAAAAVRVKARFRMRRRTPLALEPRACLAEYDRSRDALTLYSTTQVPGIIRDSLAEALDMPGHRLRVVAPDVGGGFGSKASIYPWTAALEPVQVVSFLPGPYRIENYHGRVRAVATAKAPTGPYRGVGRPTSTFVMERLMDMAASKLGLDAKEIRLRNLVGASELPYKVASGIVWDKSGFQECLHVACDTIGYDALRVTQKKARARGRWFGIGLASYAELTGIGSRISVAPGMPINTGTEMANIRIDSTGAITAAFGVASHGQGLETTLAQIVAEHLGARFEDIRIVHGDSAAVPGGTGTYASRSLVLAGGAATLAARAVRERVLNAASHLLEAAAIDLIAEGGKISVIGTDRSVTFKDVARAVYSEMGRLPPEVRGELAATKSYDPVFGTTTSATHIATVEIDPETFEIKVDRFAVAEDCGRLVNPLIVDGQVHGGVAQGIGAALYEEVIYDDQGQINTASLVDYLVPSACEIPPIQVVHLESESPTTLGGFRGMGEGGTIGSPAAIANAVNDALSPLGIEINELPITPERLFRLVKAARAGGEN